MPLTTLYLIALVGVALALVAALGEAVQAVSRRRTWPRQEADLMLADMLARQRATAEEARGRAAPLAVPTPNATPRATAPTGADA